jgi:hypothetical protein
MLQEARARMVDVETGEEPRPMRTLDEEPPARPPDPPGSRVGNRRAAKRPSSKRVSTVQSPPSVPAPSPIAGRRWNVAALDTGKLLWLGDPSGDPFAEPADGSTEIAPWRRGLRG